MDIAMSMCIIQLISAFNYTKKFETGRVVPVHIIRHIGSVHTILFEPNS